MIAFARLSQIRAMLAAPHVHTHAAIAETATALANEVALLRDIVERVKAEHAECGRCRLCDLIRHWEGQPL